jgi:hypothetical protein
MDKYKFSTPEFGISETGFHLLRSNFNYETIDFKNIDFISIKKGKLINNWVIIFLIGTGMIFFSLWYMYRLFIWWENPESRHIYIENILIPFLPIVMGGYCVYSALKTGLVVSIIYGSKQKTFPLTTIVRMGELEDFIQFLKNEKKKNVSAVVL